MRHLLRTTKRIQSFFIILLSITLPAFTQEAKTINETVSIHRQFYSGGMLFFQPGYVISANSHQKIRHNSWGVGGIVRFYLGNNLTAGLHGGSQHTGYYSSHSDNSHIKLGYGGAFIGFSRQYGRWRYSASGFIGMGAINNLHIENQTGNTLKGAYLYKHTTLVVSPLISIDYALTQRLSLTAQAVYLTANANAKNTYQNPVFQMGILFSR